jgi:hypothetical protein
MEPWRNFEQGSTIGTEGSESGRIVLDEEHPHGARITLERTARVAPFAITCGVYGWFFHTRFFADEAEANREFQAMKAGLEQIIECACDPGPEEETSRRTMQAISEFVDQFRT